MGTRSKWSLCGWSWRRILSISSRRLGKWSNMVQRSLPMWRNTRWRSWLEWRERSYSYGSPSLRSPLIIHLMVRFTSRALMELGNPSLSVPLKLRRMARSKIWVLQGYDDLGYLFLLCNNVKLIEGLRAIIFTSWE